METTFDALIPILLVAVSIVLALGLWNMMRGTNPGLSQKLMRWRIGLQFAAIVAAMLALYLMS